MKKYKDFLDDKKVKIKASGINIERDKIHKQLFEFQKDIVLWALAKGKAAIFADTGLGKTIMQLEWASKIYEVEGGVILIYAPLSVGMQTKREAKKINMDVNIAKDKAELKEGINITNYERLDKFEGTELKAIILDESSILKNFNSKYKTKIIEDNKSTKYKLACTATPSPNDYTEILNHAEFLDVGRRISLLSEYFVHDSGHTSKWRLKRHAEIGYWEWINQWSIFVDKPSDINPKYKNDDYILPKLNEIDIVFQSDREIGKCDNQLFRIPEISAMGLHKEKRINAERRAEKIKEIINKIEGQYTIWVDTNYEADIIREKTGIIEVRGSDKNEKKIQTAIDFVDGKINAFMSKSKIYGFGMNFQNCNNVIIAGLNYSYESYYQLIRRFWRYGQKKEVNIYRVIADTEQRILLINEKKKEEHLKMKTKIKQELKIKAQQKKEIKRREYNEDGIKIINNDSVVEMQNIATESIDYSIFSPPFAELYTYTDMVQDMSNCRNYEEFFTHFDFIIKELERTIKSGRNVSVHCTDIPAMKERDGYIGIKDFPGDIIRHFEKAGFIYHSRHIIWKDPLIEATRTKAIGLMHKQIVKDSIMGRAGLPDYILTFRKKGENKTPISKPTGFVRYYGKNNMEANIKKENQMENKYSHYIWRAYASPIWNDIRQTRTLNGNTKGNEDDKHICPLQLDTIARCIELYSNENEIILSPFAGVGSELYQAIEMNRKAIGIELKTEYYERAIKNIHNKIMETKAITLF